MRIFLPLPPSSPFAVHEDGRVFLRYWSGPHYPAEDKEVESWIKFLTGSDSSDHQAALTSLVEAKQEAKEWREQND